MTPTDMQPTLEAPDRTLFNALEAAARSTPEKTAIDYYGRATSFRELHRAALNLAGVLRARVVFVCSNNQYALSTTARRQTNAESFAVKASAYGFRGRRVDGNDVLAVELALRQACENARSGLGPTLVECVTYRRGPHSSSDDPTRYRSAAEEAA